MSANKTEHLQLHKWEPEDEFSRNEINENFGKLDEAVNKAAQGNCRIAVGTYVGTGTFGVDNPNTLTFPFMPKLLVLGGGQDMQMTYLMPPVTWNYVMGNVSYGLNCVWGDKSVSWYCWKDEKFQMNRAGETYYYLIIG